MTQLLLAAAVLLPAGPAVPPLPSAGLAPLLHVRIPGPPGMKVTIFPAPGEGRTYDVPLTVGLRPGYVYRMKLTHLPDRPGVTLFPTLEVHGSLKVSGSVSGSRFPAAPVWTPADLLTAVDGGMLTKVVYLEDPEQAIAAQGDPDRPFEVERPLTSDLLQEARTIGRPMMVTRLGSRDVSDEELRGWAVPGTVLLPGEGRLSALWAPPVLPLTKPIFFDPRVGPAPQDDECFHDGGDPAHNAGIGPNGRLGGLDPEDTVIEYRDGRGVRQVVPSNRVCVCVPRFAVLRTTVVPYGAHVYKIVDENRWAQGIARVDTQTPPLDLHQTAAPVVVQAPLLASEMLGMQGLIVTSRTDGVVAVQAEWATTDVSALKREEVTVDKPLVLCKEVDRHSAVVGDVLTFTLKYTNRGGRAITDVAVSDSLSRRLEYITGSQQSDRAAVFTTQPNEAGSVILRWEVRGALQPGETGTLRFQARVR